MDGFIMEHPIKMDDLGGFYTPIFGLTPIWNLKITEFFKGKSTSKPP